MGKKINVMGNRSSADGDQRACADTRHGRSNDQVAQRTRVGSRIDMVMPDRSERSPQQQHQEHERDYDAPDSLLVGHFEVKFKDHARDRR